MKTLSLIILQTCLIFCISKASFGINPRDQSDTLQKTVTDTSILIKNAAGIYHNGRRLNKEEVLEYMKDYPDIADMYITGFKMKSWGIPALIVGPGGILTGIGFICYGFIGPFTGSIYYSGALTYIFTGLLIGLISLPLIPIGITFTILGSRKIINSVSDFNNKMQKQSTGSTVRFKVGLTDSGIGLRVYF